MSDRDDRDGGDVDRLIAEIRGRLQDGGPEVDPGALFAYIDDDLPEGDKREVQKRIAYWRAWHDAYWRLRADLEAGEQETEEVRKGGAAEKLETEPRTPSSALSLNRAPVEGGHAIDQRRWEAYLGWMFGMVLTLIDREVVDDGERGRLEELLMSLRNRLSGENSPQFNDGSDLWHCLLDIALGEHRGAPGATSASEGAGSGGAAAQETERDWKVEDYPDTPAFARRVAGHFRRCVALLDGWEAGLGEIALGQLVGRSDEELGAALDRDAKHIQLGLRVIRRRWQADAAASAAEKVS